MLNTKIIINVIVRKLLTLILNMRDWRWSRGSRLLRLQSGESGMSVFGAVTTDGRARRPHQHLRGQSRECAPELTTHATVQHEIHR